MSIQELTLDQLGKVSRGRSRHRPRDAAFLYGGPYPFVQTGDVKKAALYLRDYEQTYSEAGLEQSKLWPAGTLCITIAANIADTALLGIDACFPDSVIGFIADPLKADARFVKYLFDAVLGRTGGRSPRSRENWGGELGDVHLVPGRTARKHCEKLKGQVKGTDEPIT